ncbi:ATP-binding protein [bacterium]|nr:MAG: ATP-binding protein [bacterium]
MLANYWPSETQVNACIKNEAETADVAVLLAVHQPSPLTTIDVGSGTHTAVTEEDLLEAFLTDNVPGGALLFPITGASGAGKSHIIRWLDAQLQRSAKRDRLHIIRIPKSASLRTVVELILEPLQDNPRYQEAIAELRRAVAEVRVSTAAVTFRAHLENALADIRDRLAAEAQRNPDRAELRQKFGHARDLPKLFADPALSQHFVDNVLSRIVSRSLQGRAETDSEDDDDITRFQPADLILPPEVNVSDASHPVRQYYQTIIASADATRIRIPVDLLNEAIDPAMGALFQLQQSTGGVSLQDIILAVRKTLLDEGKDLVLLVEDFAALSGIQDVLLKVCIQEGEYAGETVRATMRTAIALTDGVLSFRETMYTRAQREWVVGGRALSDEEIRESTVELVGAYLNAARWGEDPLKRKFRESDGGAGSSWLSTWRDEDDDTAAEMLNAFGASRAGHPLFPFNRDAIVAMTDVHLVKNGELVFNPRKVINSILRNTLLLRSSFQSHAFPPPDLKTVVPNTFLAGWIRRAGQTDQNRRRLGPLLAIWGGNPTSPDGLASVSPGVFQAFGLPTPAELDSIEFVERPAPEPDPTAPSPAAFSPGQAEGPAKSEDGPDTPQRDNAPDPWFLEWQEKVDAWSAGTAQLSQVDANDIRKVLALMTRDAINWPFLRLREQNIRPGSIHIAHARGNVAAKRILVVCDRHEDEDGRIRAAMLGALRHARNRFSWDYPGAEDDYVAVCALVDRLVSQLTPMLLDEANEQIAALANGLVLQARIAGLSPPVRLNNAPAVLAAMFEPLPAMDPQGFDEAWEKTRASAGSDLGSKTARALLQEEVLDLTGAFQGTGSVLFAVDGVRLVDSLASVKVGEDSSLPEELSPESRAYLTPQNPRRLWAQLQTVIRKLRDFRTDLRDYIDGDFDKGAFVTELEEVGTLLSATSNWPNNDINGKEFGRSLTEFKTTPIMDLVNKATLVDEANPEQLPKVLNALGTLDLSLVDRTVSFLRLVEQIISAAEDKVEQVYASHEQANPAKVAEEIDSLLSSIANDAADAPQPDVPA